MINWTDVEGSITPSTACEKGVEFAVIRNINNKYEWLAVLCEGKWVQAGEYELVSTAKKSVEMWWLLVGPTMELKGE